MADFSYSAFSWYAVYSFFDIDFLAINLQGKSNPHFEIFNNEKNGVEMNISFVCKIVVKWI